MQALSVFGCTEHTFATNPKSPVSLSMWSTLLRPLTSRLLTFGTQTRRVWIFWKLADLCHAGCGLMNLGKRGFRRSIFLSIRIHLRSFTLGYRLAKSSAQNRIAMYRLGALFQAAESSPLNGIDPLATRTSLPIYKKKCIGR